MRCGRGNGGGGQGGSNLPLPVPFNPGSRPVFLGSRPFALFRLQKIAQCCVIFPFFSRFPPPWESRFPPPLLPPPIHLPPRFLPVSRPPVPPPPKWAVIGHGIVKICEGHTLGSHPQTETLCLTTLFSIINSNRKELLSSFHLNEHITISSSDSEMRTTKCGQWSVFSLGYFIKIIFP